MAEALLITRKDVVKFTAMNGNVDTDKFIQYIKIAQDVHIQNYVGTELLKAIQTKITSEYFNRGLFKPCNRLYKAYVDTLGNG